jgi:putative oxygen-independent coproporphyrinogen III oxidase
MSATHVYVHVPFCARRCSYCDFAIAVRRTVPVRDYLDALEREASSIAIEGVPVTVYLGGGTPSLIGGDGVAAVARIAGAAPDTVEFTVEANPDDVTPAAAAAWVASGVNRLSIGAQSFHAGVLAWMHRTHEAATIGQAVRTARAAGIANLSLDLIFALPGELRRDWRADLERAVALEPDHISLYGLTVESGTALARWIERGASHAADERCYEEEYLEAHEHLAATGYQFYEVSNAARPGREAVHNRAYWRLAPYIGLGPSAHSFDGASRWWNEPAYARWIRRVREQGSAVAGREVLDDAQRRLERLYLGLRTADGVELGDPEWDIQLRECAETWVRQGWATLKPSPARPPARPSARPSARLSLTPTGWLRLDELVATV